MTLENRLGLADEKALCEAEERISKIRAGSLFANPLPKRLAPGSFAALAHVHRHLFEQIYPFAGKLRTQNISKGGFLFAPARLLHIVLGNVERLPQGTFREIVAKYVEMNIAHPFREGNGRATRLWLDHLLCSQTKMVVDWTKIPKDAYFAAMRKSPVDESDLAALLEGALAGDTGDADACCARIDASWAYEGQSLFSAARLMRDVGAKEDNGALSGTDR